MIYNIKKRNYIKYPHYFDVLDGKVRIAYVKCPKCNRFMGLYKGEVDSFGLIKLYKKCSCGFIGRFKLENWEDGK